jgi:cell division protein FtsB
VALSPRAGRRLLLGGILVVAAYHAVLGGEYSLLQLMHLKGDAAQRRDRLAQTRAEVDSLRKVARRLEHDDAAVEKIAREQFGMIGPGETLYRFVATDSARPAEGSGKPAKP